MEVESKWHVGTDQTPVNFLTHMLDIDYKRLPYEYNMCDMFRKELLIMICYLLSGDGSINIIVYQIM